MLPGLEWGYDDATVREFEQDSNNQLVLAGQAVTSFAQRHQVLTGHYRDQWIAWRCRRLAGFYTAVLNELQAAKPDSRLILDLTVLAGSGNEDLSEALRQGRTVEEVLRGKGIDLRNSITSPDIAENGAVVPFTIASKLPKTESMALLVEKNPNILAASFNIPAGTEAVRSPMRAVAPVGPPSMATSQASPIGARNASLPATRAITWSWAVVTAKPSVG